MDGVPIDFAAWSRRARPRRAAELWSFSAPSGGAGDGTGASDADGSDAAGVPAAVPLETTAMRRVAAGDPSAQAWLVNRVIGVVRRTTRALLGNAHDADDAAQLSLLQVLRSADGYRGEGSVDAWARRIAVRTTLRYVRSEHRMRARNRRAAADASPEVVDPDPHRSEGDGLPRPVQTYLAELPAEQRDAFVLHHALGYSLDEVAELTAVSRNTVKSRLRIASRALRKRIRFESLVGARSTRGETAS